jgi:alpha-beta hydrolase superfamily lysophospholipase
MLTSALVVLALFVLLNVVAYRHAYVMTHFTAGGKQRRSASRDSPPERLTWSQRTAVLLGGVVIGRPRADVTPAAVGLAYETRVFPGAAGDLEGWYVPHPAPRGLVLIFHGYANCKARMLAEARAFHELGYACFLIDFPGSGGSAGDATTVGYREAGDVARTAAYAKEQWPGTSLVLFGQSMGAAAVLRAMAVRGVTADAAVLECPFDTMLRAVGARFKAMGLPPFPGALLMVFWGGWQHGYNAFAHKPVEYAKSVRCPVLLLHGREDRRVSVPQVESIYQNLPGEKEMHVFDGLGHESYAAKRPQHWKEWVGGFLDRRPGRD